EAVDAFGRLADLLLRLARDVAEDLLFVLTKPVPYLEIDDVHRRPVIVIGHRAVFRDLVGLEREDVDDREVGAVDDALLRRWNDLAPRHRHGVAAEPVDRVAEDLRLLHAQLHAAQILRLDDRVLAVPEMAEAVIEEVEDLELVFALELLVELGADLAVE